MQTWVLRLISMGTAQNVLEYIEYSRIIHFHHKKGGADMFKALQHIKGEIIQATREFGWFWWNCTKRTAGLFSTRCHVNVWTDGKPGPFHNRRHLIFLEWENLVKVCSLMYAKQQAFDILGWDNLVKFCSLMLARRHVFDIFELDALCCQQHRSIFLYSLVVK